MAMTAPLTITITNNLRLKHVPPELKAHLEQKLQFVNPKWEENRRMGRWNRGTPKILRFYDRVGAGGLWIPRGYTGRLIRYCRRNGISYRIEDQRRSLPPVDFCFRGKLRSFQQTAVDRMLAKDFGTLSSATGSGKTIMALYMVAHRRQPAVVVVHTRDLAAQWAERIEQFLGLDAKGIGLIGGGKKELGKPVTVALVQSLYKCAGEVAPRTGFLIVDECHRCPSRTFTEAVTAFDCRYMLGLSATPWRRDRLSPLIFWHLGELQHEVKKSRLLAAGAVLSAEVVLRETDFKPVSDPVDEYSRMLSELTTDRDRNLLIAADVAREAARSRGICLVLSDRKAHCENLQFLLRYRFKVESELMTGDLNDARRTEVVRRLNARQVKVLIATGQLIGEGFDCRQLSTLFLATPISFSGRVLQYLGRVLRPAPGKKGARVYDYVDVHVEPLKKAAARRRRVYRQ